jgi:hypothetical protein
MADTKISEMASLTGASADVAADVVPVLDVSEIAGSRNKKMTLEEVAKAVSPRLRITWDGAITVETA